jgi:hypothetical protein
MHLQTARGSSSMRLPDLRRREVSLRPQEEKGLRYAYFEDDLLYIPPTKVLDSLTGIFSLLYV